MSTVPQRAASAHGRTAVVTGSTSGIGRACARMLAQAGYRVAIHGRSARAAADVVAELAATHGADRVAGTFLADLSEEAAAIRLADEFAAGLGRIDAVVAIAGADVLTGPPAAWPFDRKLEELLKVDLAGTIAIARTLGRRMADDAGGSIVTVGWDQAAVGMEGDSGELFAAVKGGVMAFTRSLARSLAPKVRVNCVAPGWIRTKWGEGASDAWQRRAVRESVLGRWGTPDDVADAAAWLVSDDAAFVTGQVIAVNGGFRRG